MTSKLVIYFNSRDALLIILLFPHLLILKKPHNQLHLGNTSGQQARITGTGQHHHTHARHTHICECGCKAGQVFMPIQKYSNKNKANTPSTSIMVQKEYTFFCLAGQAILDRYFYKLVRSFPPPSPWPIPPPNCAKDVVDMDGTIDPIVLILLVVRLCCSEDVG